MLSWFSDFVDSLAPSTTLRRENPLHHLSLAVVGVVFVLFTTLIIAYDTLFPAQQDTSTLGIGNVVEQDIRAPYSIEYVSDVLTEQRREAAASAIASIYDPPDPTIARQQATLLQQIFDFIENIRHDPYATPTEKSTDLQAITAVRLDPPIIDSILQFDDDTWRAISGEAVNVLERVMREPIRESDLSVVRDQLPSQVALRFDSRQASVIVALVQDVLRPNRFVNPAETETARQSAVDSVQPESRRFERGQIVVRAGTALDAIDYEALDRLGLLQSADRRVQTVVRAVLASLLSLVLIGLYFARFPDPAYIRGRFLALMCFIFLLSLFSARLFAGVQPPYYIYPAAGLALLLVVLSKPEIAIIGTLVQGLLIGLIANNSLEITTLVIAGGMVGSLILRRTERLNSFFVIGMLIAVTNVVVITLFNLELLSSSDTTTLSVLIIYGLINGILAAMVALVGMYALTFVLNLPTSLKLVELSQPNQPLLQRLLREAPGTYQHSLQVANLCEQAANALGANAEVIRVAALYHDIGKMLNPAFFVENQADNLNPHDALDDPYRSASIIIGHVTEGERLAKQYRLPVRMRDFILEHHGTTKVGYFYTKAVEQAGDTESVDVDQFTYPGPKPQSRETAIMMLADNCESTVRARKPANRQAIAEIVDAIFDQRMREGQLDEFNLTLRDLDVARNIFLEMLQAVFHPRINYPTLPSTVSTLSNRVTINAENPLELPALTTKGKTAEIAVARDPDGSLALEPSALESPSRIMRRQTVEIKAVPVADDEDTPLQDIPPLRRTKTLSAVEAEEYEPDAPQTPNAGEKPTPVNNPAQPDDHEKKP